jgi:hypothetical protein
LTCVRCTIIPRCGQGALTAEHCRLHVKDGRRRRGWSGRCGRRFGPSPKCAQDRTSKQLILSSIESVYRAIQPGNPAPTPTIWAICVALVGYELYGVEIAPTPHINSRDLLVRKERESASRALPALIAMFDDRIPHVRHLIYTKKLLSASTCHGSGVPHSVGIMR